MLFIKRKKSCLSCKQELTNGNSRYCSPNCHKKGIEKGLDAIISFRNELEQFLERIKSKTMTNPRKMESCVVCRMTFIKWISVQNTCSYQCRYYLNLFNTSKNQSKPDNLEKKRARNRKWFREKHNSTSRNPELDICVSCQKEIPIERRFGLIKTCSKLCSKERHKEMRRKRLGQKERQYLCKGCQKPISGRPNKKYCSLGCHHKSYYLTKKDYYQNYYQKRIKPTLKGRSPEWDVCKICQQPLPAGRMKGNIKTCSIECSIKRRKIANSECWRKWGVKKDLEKLNQNNLIEKYNG